MKGTAPGAGERTVWGDRSPGLECDDADGAIDLRSVLKVLLGADVEIDMSAPKDGTHLPLGSVGTV
jgi:hypothetical protein